MSENSVPANAGHSRPPGQPAGDLADALDAGADADATARPDRMPTADAFDTLASFAAPEPDEGDGNDGNPRASADEGAAVTAIARWLARLPGERRHWTMGGMVAGGVLLGGLLSGGIAWKMVSSRDAEVAARTIRLDAQSSRLAAQAAKIEVLTRAISERPLPDDRDTETVAQSATSQTAAGASTSAPATAATAATADKTIASSAPSTATPPVTLAPATPPSDAAGQVTAAPAAAGPPAAVARAEVPRRVEPEARVPTGVSPGQAGSGICDVPSGSDGAARMRKCIEWFAGRDKGATRPAP